MGKRAGYNYIGPTGSYTGQPLPQGFFGLLDVLTPGTYLPHKFKRWRGKHFVASTSKTDAWGDNMFVGASGDIENHMAFFVNHDVKSVIDGLGGTASLDYMSHGGNGWAIVSHLQEEIRCIHADLCLG